MNYFVITISADKKPLQLYGPYDFKQAKSKIMALKSELSLFFLIFSVCEISNIHFICDTGYAAHIIQSEQD